MIQRWMCFLVALLFDVFLLLTRMRPGKGTRTTLKGAELAISHLQEYAKWMAGIQITALGGLGYLVFNSKVCTRASGHPGIFFAFAAFVFLGLSLLLSAVLLFSLPTIALRIHQFHHDLNRKQLHPASYDVLGMRIYSWLPAELSAGTTLHSCLWAAGLVCLGIFVVLLLSHCPNA